MSAAPTTRRRVELVLVPLVAAFCMALVIGAIVLDRDGGPCPSPNWNNQLTLSLAGNLNGMTHAAAVSACIGAECVPLAPGTSAAAAALQPVGNTRPLTPQENGTWLLNIGAQPPSAVNFSVFDRNGKVLATQSTALNWTRVSGSESCGGRMAGINVVMDMP